MTEEQRDEILRLGREVTHQRNAVAYAREALELAEARLDEAALELDTYVAMIASVEPVE